MTNPCFEMTVRTGVTYLPVSVAVVLVELLAPEDTGDDTREAEGENEGENDGETVDHHTPVFEDIGAENVMVETLACDAAIVDDRDGDRTSSDEEAPPGADEEVPPGADEPIEDEAATTTDEDTALHVPNAGLHPAPQKSAELPQKLNSEQHLPGAHRYVAPCTAPFVPQ
jgi:hypothetical protein